MSLDIPSIKSANPLRSIMERRGHVFSKGTNGTVKTRCPFHDERTSSFHLYPDHHYHCYGCGAHGDVFDWWRHFDALPDFKDQGFAARLAEITGAPYRNEAPSRRAQPAPRQAEPEAALHRMTRHELDKWTESTRRFLDDPAEIERWADWRGINPALLAACAAAGLLGVHPYRGVLREAFLIQAPASATEDVGRGQPGLFPHSIHVRLAPGTPGNPDAKQSWRYDPTSGKNFRVVSFPFILSAHSIPFEHNMLDCPTWNTTDIRFLLFCEGQWDALALADALGWHSLSAIPAHTAIIGLRGATSWRRYLDYCRPRPDATAICISDADRAGDQWFAPDGFLSQLGPLCSRVVAYRPTAPGCKDVNDLLKAGQLGSLRDHLRRRLQSQRAPPAARTFVQHLRFLRHSRPDLTPAISHVLSDPRRPSPSRPASAWAGYFSALPQSDLATVWQSWLHGGDDQLA